MQFRQPFNLLAIVLQPLTDLSQVDVLLAEVVENAGKLALVQVDFRGCGDGPPLFRRSALEGFDGRSVLPGVVEDIALDVPAPAQVVVGKPAGPAALDELFQEIDRFFDRGEGLVVLSAQC